MGKTGSVKHTHKYYQRNDKMWACSGIEGCTHYMPRNMAPAPSGMKSLCWGCEKEIQLNPFNMTDTHPMCDTCSDKSDTLNDYIEEKLKGIEKPTGLAAFGAKPRTRTIDEILNKPKFRTPEELAALEADDKPESEE